MSETTTLTCGLTRPSRAYCEDWPIYFTGWVKGVDSSYDFDAVLKERIPAHLKGRIMTDSESSQIFVYAKDEEAAEWITEFCNALSAHLTDTSLAGRLTGFSF